MRTLQKRPGLILLSYWTLKGLVYSERYNPAVYKQLLEITIGPKVAASIGKASPL